MRNILVVFFSLILAVGLVGCDSNDNSDGPGPTAQARFMHASPGAGPVDVVVDGETVASDFGFSVDQQTFAPNTSDYLDVPVSADASLEVQTGDGTAVISTTVGDLNLEEDTQYTVVVAGTPGENAPQAIVLRDQFRDELGQSEIGLRLVHGAATPGPVDIYLNQPNTDLISEELVTANFQFGDDFPGQFRGQFAAQAVSDEGSVLVVTPAGETNRVLELPVGTGTEGSLDVQPGQHVTGVAIDAPETQQPAGALIQIDTPGS